MNIVLIGYGKMGQMIEASATERGHNIVARLRSSHTPDELISALKSADCAIEFTRPEAVVANIYACINTGVPVVVGTTGWQQHMGTIKDYCAEKNASLLYGSNFSTGVNLFFSLNRFIASKIKQFNEYKITMEEIHHQHKIDSPSGTAIKLADDIIKDSEQYTSWKNSPALLESELEIKSIREGDVTGTHILTFTGPDDQIVIEHKAFNRKGFAKGAVLGAEWLLNKKGFFSVEDMLNI